MTRCCFVAASASCPKFNALCGARLIWIEYSISRAGFHCQNFQYLPCCISNLFHRNVERLLIRPRRLAESTHFSHVLQGRLVDFLLRGGTVGQAQGFDASAHGSLLLPDYSEKKAASLTTRN